MQGLYLFLFRTSFCVFLCLNVCKFGVADLASERASLLALRQAVGGRSLLWNVSSPSPCTWTGVFCENNRVIELRFPGMGLSGIIPVGIWKNFTELHTLSLRFNALSGSIPPDFGELGTLRNLYLQGNFFSGEIPDFIYGMQNLVRLNLGSNNFSGEISPKFNNLTRLATLYLEQNQLTGSIPDLPTPPLEQFNVSFNHLSGPIPTKFSGSDSSSFAGNLLCGKPLESCNGTESGGGGGGKKLSGAAIAGIVIGSIIGVLLIIAILVFCCRKKSKTNGSRNIKPAKAGDFEIASHNKDVAETHNLGAGQSAVEAKADFRDSGSKSLVFFGNVGRPFDLEDLLRASAEVLGKGTFGTAYKATLVMGIVVGVKRLKEVSVAEREFRDKIEEVGKMVHENLVSLKAYYFSRDEKLLVYDYMPMGSLSALLHGNNGAGRTPLNWETRSSIALGAARGIAYLHSQGPTASHGNIKSSNILLTRSYEARVSDFGLAHLALPSSTPNRVSGYRAPEVTDTQKISQKADVYSFGVMLLELLTGKPPTHSLINEDGVDLPRWVRSVVREEWNNEVFDLELLRYQTVEDEMVQLLQLALDCTSQHPDSRPSMNAVAIKIEELCCSKKKEDKIED